jgi:hypothetical protein
MSARRFGKTPMTRWAEKSWTDLTADAQWLYMHLMSQPTTDTAGVFPIRVTKWAKAAADMAVERVRAAARLLTERGWIAADGDTEEGLIRNYIRDDWAGDKIFIGALGRTLLCQSALLRAVLLHEIENLGRAIKPDFREQVDSLITDLRESIPPDLDVEVLPTSPVPTSSATTLAIDRRSIGDHDFRNNGADAFAEGIPVGSVKPGTLADTREPHTAICGYCGAEFEAKDPRTKYCSDAHRQAEYRERSQL